MDSDIVKELKKLEDKKQEVNAQTDLTKHCDSLVALDNRVGRLLDEIRALHLRIERGFSFMENKWDRLGPSYKTLQRTSDALDLVISLTKLNRLCRRIDTNPNLTCSSEGTLSLKKTSALNSGENEENVDDNDDKMTLQMILNLFNSFERIYKPLEDILSKRLDLPYIAYATKVRNLKESITKQDADPKSAST